MSKYYLMTHKLQGEKYELRKKCILMSSPSNNIKNQTLLSPFYRQENKTQMVKTQAEKLKLI